MSVALRTLPPLLFGKEHPYGVPFTGTGDPAVVQKLTRNDLASFHHRWIRADNAEIFAVGNTSLSELKPLLEKSFGLWRMTRDMKGRKNFDVPTPAAQQRIILVNRPQSPQSVILAGEVLDAKGTRSEEHTSELQSLMRISYAVLCLKKKTKNNKRTKKQ